MIFLSGKKKWNEFWVFFFWCGLLLALVKWQSLFLLKDIVSGWQYIPRLIPCKRENVKGPTCGTKIGAYVMLCLSIFSFIWVLGLSCLGFLHTCGHPILDMRAIFLRGRCGFLLHSLSLPIFSTKHALVKEKGFGNPMP